MLVTNPSALLSGLVLFLSSLFQLPNPVLFPFLKAALPFDPFLFLFPIIGIILGIVFKCKKLPVGKGMSTAGIITSAIGLAIPIALLAFVVVMLLTNGAELMQNLKQISPDQYEQLYEMYGDQFPQWFDAAVSFLIK